MICQECMQLFTMFQETVFTLDVVCYSVLWPSVELVSSCLCCNQQVTSFEHFVSK